MKVTVRGWSRDMGEKELTTIFLPTTEYRDDGTAYRSKPVMYDGNGGITVAWYQHMSLTGNYRMEVQLQRYDIMRLFKAAFGSEIQSHVVEKYGLTFSPE